MSDEYVEYLKNDAKRMELALRLFDYARELLEFDHGWTPGDMLPEGTDPENIVLEVFSRVASGRRKLNTRFELEVQLKGMVRSLISALYKSTNAKLETIDLPEEDAGFPGVEKALGVGSTDSRFESEEYTKRFFELLEAHPKVQKDPDLGIAIMAYVEGAGGSAEVAKETGIPVERIYEYNRILKPILRDVQSKMK